MPFSSLSDNKLLLYSTIMIRAPRLSDLPDKLTTEEFWSLVGQIEHEQLEFKVKPARLLETIAAFAMTDGGWVVLGVADDRNLVGCPSTQDVLDQVTAAAHACGLEVQCKEILAGRARLTTVAIPEIRGRVITTPDGRLLRRVGSNNQPLIGDALGRFVRERENRSAEEEAMPMADPDEFDLNLINHALEADERAPVTRSELIRALGDLDLVRHQPPPADALVTKAAVLVFGRNPIKYFSGASVQVVRRVGVGPGPGPTHARKELKGPIPLLLTEALAFVEKHTSRHEAVVGKHREILSEYPAAVLREAILNALAHRDYGLEGATVDITIWDDRIEVRSPGSLPGHITLENIRQEHYSRNRRIMRSLKMLGLVEEYGEGVDRMFREMEARLMEPPTFIATHSSVTVTLRNRSLLSVEDQAWLALLGHLDLSPQERRVLVILRREGETTRRRVKELLPDADAESLLTGAVAKGLLVQMGRRGGSRYVLSDELVARAGAEGVEARSRQKQMLLDEIRRRGSLSTVEAAEFLKEDRAIVRHLLNDLTRARLAKAKGRTRGRRYYAL